MGNWYSLRSSVGARNNRGEAEENWENKMRKKFVQCYSKGTGEARLTTRKYILSTHWSYIKPIYPVTCIPFLRIHVRDEIVEKNLLMLNVLITVL